MCALCVAVGKAMCGSTLTAPNLRFLARLDAERNAICSTSTGMSDDSEIVEDPCHGHLSRMTDTVFPLVYHELHRLAHQKLRHERPGHEMQTTDLIHEAYLRLTSGEKPVPWENRRHFFGAAAESMRRILIEFARRRRQQKRGGDRRQVDLDRACPCTAEPRDDLLAINDAIDHLADTSPVVAELVKLRFFAGMTIDETAELLGVSHATVERKWAFARAWLYGQLNRAWEVREFPAR